MAGSVPAVALKSEALPPASPLDGPDLANKRAGWKKFPMIMRHPAEQAAVVSNDRQVDANGREVWVNSPPGQAIKFGPVTVLNEHQEELHLSKGYRSAGDPVALARTPTPPGYQYAEYPRILEDGTIDEGPDAPAPPDNFYPYWVRMAGWPDELVQDREEHQALLKKRGVEEPPPPAPEVDPRDAKISTLEEQIAELKALVVAAVRQNAGQPALAEDKVLEMQRRALAGEVPPVALEPAAQVSDEPVATDHANLQADPQAEVDLQAPEKLAELIEGKGEVDPNGPAIVIAIGKAKAGEPSAEDAIKARIAELDAEEAALEAEEPAEAPAKQGKRK